jgi:hypothetical protein
MEVTRVIPIPWDQIPDNLGALARYPTPPRSGSSRGKSTGRRRE